MKKIYLFLLILVNTISIYAQEIRSKNGNINLTQIAEKLTLNDVDFNYCLLSYKYPLSEINLAELKSSGIEIIYYLSARASIIKRNNSTYDFTKLGHTNEYLFYKIPRELKLSTDLYRKVRSGTFTSEVEVLVSVFEQDDLKLVETFTKQKGLSFRYSKDIAIKHLIIKISSVKQLNELLAQNHINYIDIYIEKNNLESSSNSMFSNQIFNLNYDRKGPAGRNTYFSNIEHYGGNTLFRLNFKGRNHPLYGSYYEDHANSLIPSHGTSVSMYAASSNNINEYENRGMAEEAICVQMPNYASIEDYYLTKNIQPLTLNVSAGVGGTSVNYNSEASEFDRITRNLKGFTLCFAAGNNGNTNNTALNYGPGWANISGDHKTGKNTIVVHAAGKPGEHFDWTCKGPTADGRLKPDISAEGQYGTSYASPNLAGLVNVLYESYQNSYQQSPRSDVIKAVILNTAIDADKPGIDFKSGFGTVNPIAAHKAISNKQIITNSVAQGNGTLHQYPLSIPNGLKQIKILLYWHDYPGNPGAAKALVNDLDLKIVDPQSNIVLPWVLDARPGFQYNLAQRKIDSLNNVEQITIDNPVAGNYTIEIKGKNIPMGPQEYVVTYELLPYHIEITSPVKNFRTARNKTILFTWNSAIDTNNTNNTLEIILQKQTNETMVLATVRPNQKYYSYTIPGNFPYSSTARIIVRQKNTNISDTSDYFHVNEIPSQLSFDKICKDEIKLKWLSSSVAGTEYIIYRLAEKYMEEIARVSYPTTSILLNAQSILGANKEFSTEEVFAIAAKHPNGAVSLRSNVLSTKQSSLINTSTPLPKEIILCYGDSAIVNAFDLQRDSIRWFYNSKAVENTLSIKLKGNNRGYYYYKIYQKNSCVFISDTFLVKGPVDFTDTLAYGNRNWNLSVFKNNDTKLLYGKLIIKQLSINSLLYYNEFEQINHADAYEGCAPGMIYTIVYKRKGFTNGTYTINLKKVQYQIKIYLDGNLIYNSPSNSIDLGNVWSGKLNDQSEIRIVHLVQGKPIINLEFIPTNYSSPGGVSEGLCLWLNANKTIRDSSNTIVRWIDNYLYSLQNDAEKGSSITSVSNAINYNPSIKFNKSGGLYGAFPSAIINSTAYSIGVFKMNSNSNAKARVFSFALPSIYADDNYNGTYIPIGRIDSSNTIGLIRLNNKLPANGNRMDSWQMISTQIKPNLSILKSNGTLDASANHNFQGFFYSTLNIGAKADSIRNEGRLDGEIAEIIHYNRDLNKVEEEKINTYLALKYSMPLTHVYRSASAKIIYNPFNYNYGIAGIAREDKQELSQRQSSSNDLFIGSLGILSQTNNHHSSNFINDSSFIIWGHNNANLQFGIKVNDTCYQLNRVWKLKKTNYLQTFRFNFKDTSLFEANTCLQYQLVILDPLNNSVISKYNLNEYTDQDLQKIYYTDINLFTDSILFSLIKTERNLSKNALAINSKSAFTCINDNSFVLIDSNNTNIVAEILANSNINNRIINTSVISNEDPQSLANCNDTMRIIVLNRFFTNNLISGLENKHSVILYFTDTDSTIAIASSGLQNGKCKLYRNKLKWFIEEDINTVKNKINSFSDLIWLNDSVLIQGTDLHNRSITINNITNTKYVIGAALIDTSKIIKPVGLILKKNLNISVFPNPFKSELKFTSLPRNCTVEIYNTIGQCLHQKMYAETEFYVSLTLPESIYFIRILHNNEIIYTRKFIQEQ